MNEAHRELLKVLSECHNELKAIEMQAQRAYEAACGTTNYEYRRIDWGHVGDAKRLLADLKDIRRHWAPNMVAK